jgi:hypothetical protein
VISSHAIEHMEDPIAALKSYLRVLKPRGIALIVVPDQRVSFDKGRGETSFDHLVDDHERGPHLSRLGHFVEWAEFVYGQQGQAAITSAQGCLAMNYSIHFHCWGPFRFLEFLYGVKRRYDLPFDLLLFFDGGSEFTCVLRKS